MCVMARMVENLHCKVPTADRLSPTTSVSGHHAARLQQRGPKRSCVPNDVQKSSTNTIKSWQCCRTMPGHEKYQRIAKQREVEL
jgi:hypothetical protein